MLNQIIIKLKNYGNVPARVVRTREIFSEGETRITQKQLRSSPNSFFSLFTIFPYEVSRYQSQMNLSIQKTSFAGILIEYEYYPDKHGDCGFIAKYIHDTRSLNEIEFFSNQL
jgi:hypothetical protein